jgi:hypothetical protein
LEKVISGVLFRAMTMAVTLDSLDRLIAIDALKKRLESRSDRRHDLQSALIVCELMDLGTVDGPAVDEAVRSAFKRGQMDTEFVGRSSWDDVDSHGINRDDSNAWTDPASELSTWCHDFVSEDMDLSP